jgi:hypothetical protein
VIHSSAKAVELLFASSVAGLLRPETHLPQEMVPNVEIVTKILDEIQLKLFKIS